MASLLEQTVEYINTMHTVLNEDKPDCLSKIYTLYQKKIEDYDLFRKANTPKSSKRNMTSINSSNVTPTSSFNENSMQHRSPGIFQVYPGNRDLTQDLCSDESGVKRRCVGHQGWDQDYFPRVVATPAGSSGQTWQPQQLLIDPMTDANNNIIHSSAEVPFRSENKFEKMLPNSYVFGSWQSPLTNQSQIGRRPDDQPFPFPNGPYLPYSKFCGDLLNTSSMDSPFHSEMMPNSFSKDDDAMRTTHSDSFKGERGQTSSNVSNLIPDGGGRDNPVVQINNLSWNQQYNIQAPSPASFNHTQQNNQNATHNLLAPMDLTESPKNGASKRASSGYVGVCKLIEKGQGPDLPSSSAGMGILLRSSTVSSMLSEVTATSAYNYPKVFGSTERRMTPVLSARNNEITTTLTVNRPTSAPVVGGDYDSSAHMKILTPSTCSPTAEKLYDELVGSDLLRPNTLTSISSDNQELSKSCKQDTPEESSNKMAKQDHDPVGAGGKLADPSIQFKGSG